MVILIWLRQDTIERAHCAYCGRSAGRTAGASLYLFGITSMESRLFQYSIQCHVTYLLFDNAEGTRIYSMGNEDHRGGMSLCRYNFDIRWLYHGLLATSISRWLYQVRVYM